MGVGSVDFIDPDVAEDSNRNRQLFTAADVGKPKAHQVLINLEPYATYRTVLRGYYMTFEQWASDRRRPRYHVICCGVDSLPTMVAVAKYGLATNTTVVYTNVSEDGECSRIFIQRPGPDQACFGCYRPSVFVPVKDARRPCAPVPAIADILHVAVGLAARATVGEILGVPIGDYNCRDISFSGIDLVKTVNQRPGCPLCSTRSDVAHVKPPNG